MSVWFQFVNEEKAVDAKGEDMSNWVTVIVHTYACALDVVFTNNVTVLFYVRMTTPLLTGSGLLSKCSGFI
jgi:hypothetical protein